MKPGQLKTIRSLLEAHSGSLDVVSVGLCRRLSKASFLSRRMVGVLLDRKGAVRWVMVGDATRLYLPDIGRVRGHHGRLRGLRLIVARPTPLNVKNNIPLLCRDLKTDLEKLRLDAVVEIDASRDDHDGPIILGYLSKQVGPDGDFNISALSKSYRSVHELKLTFPQVLNSVTSDIRNIFDQPESQKAKVKYSESAILVGIYSCGRDEAQRSMVELKELARSAKVNVVDEVMQLRPKINPKTVIGPGKLEEICLRALSLGVELLIFDLDLTPSQLLKITDLTDLKVLDRTMLILDIFAQRAVTREGKLQVEMAQLNYSLPRLQEKQTGLSRLTGGIGGRGPGETKLEVNRRRVRERIARLKRELQKIKDQRGLRRKVRKFNALPTLAIIGYTNAGKSTLLNALCGSKIYAKDELFATLDPHSRRLRFPHEQEVLITDTVGFINHLPETLMRAFMATLEELDDADLLIHVIDVSDKNYTQHIKVVEKVLKDLALLKKPRLLVFNKVDKLSVADQAELPNQLHGVITSAANGFGLKGLIAKAADKLMDSLAVGRSKGFKMGHQHDQGEVVFDERLKR